MRCWMPFIVALVAFLVIPVLLIIGAGIAAFSIAAAASVNTTSSDILCE
jgi:O-antigen ligase